jgi:hypothetical protein
MPFVKLDTGILHSTLWVERELREVFITALLMAEPHEIEAPTPQIENRGLKETGFVVPPGWYGFVESAGVGIIHQARVPEEEGYAALEKLGLPDIESRTKAFDGRRMVRVDGGFVILNYMLYRDKDHSAADRMRRLRARRKQSVRRNSDAVRPNVTQAESREQRAEADKSTPGDLESLVREIAALYPKIRDAQHLSQAVQHAIAEAIARDGRDLVWMGTKSMAEKVARWPKSDLKFIPAPDKFFRDSGYRADPAEWERSSHGTRNSGAVHDTHADPELYTRTGAFRVD